MLVVVDVGHDIVHLLHGIPQYSPLRVLLPFVGEADEAPALRKSTHVAVPVSKAARSGGPCH